MESSIMKLIGLDNFKDWKKTSIIILLVASMTSLAAVAEAQTIRYVKEGGTGDGSSWANASGDLQEMISASISGDEVWVAGGIYKPVRPLDDLGGSNDPTNKDNSFFIASRVKVYGGFAGNESSLSERDLSIKENRSILSGDIDGDGVTDDDNAFHVVVLASGILDGFTVTGGYANNSFGGSVQVSENPKPEIFRNSGGGIVVLNSFISELSNLIVKNNYAYYSGGGIHIEDRSDELTPVLLTNVVIAGNGAVRFGGAIGVDGSDVTLTNGSVSGNSSGENTTIHVWGESLLKVRNSILYGNDGAISAEFVNAISEVSSSLVEGSSSTENGNIASTDPKFVNAPAPGNAPFSNGDYRLLNGSAALDAGDNTLFNSGETPDLSGFETDVAGDDRIQSGTVDLGAYEGSLPEPFVTNDNDNGPGSLRYVVENTFDGSTITFDESLNAGTITLTGGQITVDKSITIDAGDLPNGITVSGDNNSRVFEVESGLEVTFRSLAITDGSASSAAGIRNTGDLTLENVAVYGNSTTGNFGGGGGILNNGSSSRLTIRNSTISSNNALGGDESGGGIYNEGSVSLIHTTLSDNKAGVSGGGVASFGSSSSLQLTNSVIANSEGGDCVASGDLDESDSLVEDGSCSATSSGDPMLKALAYYGGATYNQPPDVGSPLLDAGSCIGLTEDQRGFDRPVDLDYIANSAGTCDIGSVEANSDDIPVEDIFKPSNGVLYVDQNVPAGGTQNGSSWTNAIPEFSTALRWAGEVWGPEKRTLRIWLADGKYTTTKESDRNASFQLVNNVEIYGGFDGDENENQVTDRDWSVNPTILSGDIDNNDSDNDNDGVISSYVGLRGNNSYHVVNGTGTDNSAKLSGVIITAGQANGSGADSRGGGLYNENGSPILDYITFIGNSATEGGAIANFSGSDPDLYNVVITGNNADEAGGIYNSQSNPTLTNATIYNNLGGVNASALLNSESDPTLANVIIWSNYIDGDKTTPEASIYNVSSSTPSISYSIIENSGGSDNWNSDLGTDNGNNLDEDPGFKDTNGPYNGADGIFGSKDDGYSILQGSSAIDAGSNDLLPGNYSVDLAGEPRIYDGATAIEIVDIGAYEYQGETLSISPDGNNILYVDLDVDTEAGGYTGLGDSWENALPELSTALGWANNNWDGNSEGSLQIWVADGVYKPTTNTDQAQSFNLTNHVEVYGGFTGMETSLSERDWETNTTILSGDIDSNDEVEIVTSPTSQITGNNSYHVVNGSNADDTAVLDGFTITAGHASDNSAPNNDGGGVYNDSGSATFRNLTITGNRSSRYGAAVSNRENSNPTIMETVIKNNFAGNSGGGIYNNDSNPVLADVTIQENITADNGGGIYSHNNSSPVLTNVKIIGNRARSGFNVGTFGGGGMYNNGGAPILTNLLFSGNVADENSGSSGGFGGAILNVNSSPILTNVTVTGNVSDNGGAIYNSSSGTNVDIRNSIIWNNQDNTGVGTASSSIVNTNSATTTISYSMVQGQNPSGDGNLDGTDSNNAPMFVTSVNPSDAPTVAGNFQLQEGSPGISIGNNVIFESGQTPDLSGINTDLDGNVRIKNARVDMGAYEFQGDEELLITPDENNIVYVDQNVSGGIGSGDSWSNAITELRDALTWAANWDGDADGTLQIWVAEGTYLPTDDGTDREASFTLVDQVEIYGGFAGNETNLEERDPQANESILSGDIDQNDLIFEPQTDSDGDPSNPTQTDHIVGGNSYSVVYLNEDGVSVHLDGFTVTGGLANVEGSSGERNETDSGGGLFIISDDGIATMKNLVIEGNYGEDGGGMFNRTGGRFSNIRFLYNVGNLGGGMANSVGSRNPLLENFIFKGNHATGNGGGMYSDGLSTMVNALFAENSARRTGGLLVAPGNMTIIGSTFTRNSAEELAGAIRTARQASLINVIIWDNELGGNKDIPEASFSSDINIDISSSIIANSGGSTNWRVSEYADDGGSNLDVDPIFADPENGDYSLSISSPAINRGDNTPFTSGEIAEGITTDVAGNPRIYDGDPDPDFVDMGAYEFQDEPFGYPFLISPSNFETRVAVSTTFQWEEARLAEAYDLQLSLSPDFSNPVIDQSGLATNEYSPSGELRYGVTYYWRVRGTSSTLNGAWSTGQFQTTISNAGDGSEATPWEVATADQLNAVRLDRDGYFIQTADIDLSEVTREGGSYWNEGLGWEPIGKAGGSFLGNYNGNGHIITGMYINRPDRERTGLFGSVSTATILGLGIVDPEIDGGNQTGGLAGLFNDGTILESYVSGGSVTGDNQTGGLVGVTSNTNTLIENVYAGANVTGQDGTGGLIGDVTGTLNNVYSFSSVSGISNDGALIGTGSPTGNSEWYFSTETGSTDNGTGTGLDGEQMRQQASFSGFDFSSMWQIQSGDFTSYPYLRLFTYDEPLAEPEANPLPGLFIDDASVVLLSSPTDNSENVSLTPLFDWNAADGADSYDLVVSPNSDFSDPVVDETGVTDTEFQTVDELNVSTIYYWRARGVNAIGPGEWSEAFNFTTLPEVPAAIVLTAPADESINVGLVPEFTWETNDGVETYQIQVSENDDLSSPVIDESGLENPSFTPANDLANAEVYYWRVRGINAGGEGAWSEVFSFTTLPESSEVVILIAPADGAEDVSRKPLFEWNAADGADSYDLVVSPNSDFSDPVIDETGITKTEFQTADDLSFSTTYNWRARGRNAAGPGEWSESFSFTTRDQPEAEDKRLMLVNNESYAFSPSDFGQTDNNHSVVIEQIPSDFEADLELDGNVVSDNDEISVQAIENGDLTYAPPQDQYGYNFDDFEFSIKDDEGNQSEESYKITIDLGSVFTELSGSEGWRFMANPSDGDSYGDLLSGITVEIGPPPSQTLYELDQENYEWDPVESTGDESGAGTPFIIYVLGDELPVTVQSGENWEALDGTFSYSVLDYDGDGSSPNPGNYYLLGNPHPIALDFCEFTGDNIATSAYFWDPDANGGNGDYSTLNCAASEDVLIAPFQSFWVRITDSNPSLEIP
ncbi:choice-of-anchor Q domain-containing protein, partial [Rhodohalobacter sulfatireducens]